MAKSLQVTAGLTAAPRAPPCRVSRLRSVATIEAHVRWRRCRLAAHHRSPLVRVSSSQFVSDDDEDEEEEEEEDDDDLTSEETVAEVEALLADADLNAQEGDEEGAGEVAPEMPVEAAVEAVEDQAGSGDTAPAESAKSNSEGAPQYVLNFLWLDRNVAVAVDQLFSKAEEQNQKSPLTEYYFWPRNDAWEELKTCLEGKPWISDRDKILLLNRTTEVINFWQDEEKKHTIEEAKDKFPDCTFSGA